MSASVQPAREPRSKSKSAPRSPVIWTIIFLSIAAAALLALGWSSAGQEFLRQRVHPFRVTSVDIDDKVMTLVHGNQTYVVSCDERCREFRPSTNYPMQDKGLYLELREGDQTLRFRIIEEQTTFDTLGGHG